MKSLAPLPGKEDCKGGEKSLVDGKMEENRNVYFQKLIGTVLKDFWLARVDCIDF